LYWKSVLTYNFNCFSHVFKFLLWCRFFSEKIFRKLTFLWRYNLMLSKNSMNVDIICCWCSYEIVIDEKKLRRNRSLGLSEVWCAYTSSDEQVRRRNFRKNFECVIAYPMIIMIFNFQNFQKKWSQHRQSSLHDSMMQGFSAFKPASHNRCKLFWHFLKTHCKNKKSDDTYQYKPTTQAKLTLLTIFMKEQLNITYFLLPIFWRFSLKKTLHN
jgi:hypothetical protein